MCISETTCRMVSVGHGEPAMIPPQRRQVEGLEIRMREFGDEHRCTPCSAVQRPPKPRQDRGESNISPGNTMVAPVLTQREPPEPFRSNDRAALELQSRSASLKFNA